MLYMHDVWVNWFEGEENGYNVCSFHEWRKDDQIELLDQIPLLYINEQLYDHIENNLGEIPKRMLDKIYNRAFVRKGAKKTPLSYAAVITNGKNILAFYTDEYEIPIRKSRLIPRQEEIVYSLIKKHAQKKLNYNGYYYKKEYHILSMHSKYMFGLTRRERQLKQLLMLILDDLSKNNNLEELRYWLTEWKPEKYSFIRYWDEQKVWCTLYDQLKTGWSLAHEQLGEKMIKSYPLLEKLWNIEQSYNDNRTKLK